MWHHMRRRRKSWHRFSYICPRKVASDTLQLWAWHPKPAAAQRGCQLTSTFATPSPDDRGLWGSPLWMRWSNSWNLSKYKLQYVKSWRKWECWTCERKPQDSRPPHIVDEIWPTIARPMYKLADHRQPTYSASCPTIRQFTMQVNCPYRALGPTKPFRHPITPPTRWQILMCSSLL